MRALSVVGIGLALIGIGVGLAGALSSIAVAAGILVSLMAFPIWRREKTTLEKQPSGSSAAMFEVEELEKGRFEENSGRLLRARRVGEIHAARNKILGKEVGDEDPERDLQEYPHY